MTDAAEVTEIVDRLRGDDVRNVFVVAGDAEEPRGPFHGAIDLLVTTIGGPARLFRNVAPRRGHWLTVRALDDWGAVTTQTVSFTLS